MSFVLLPSFVVSTLCTAYSPASFTTSITHAWDFTGGRVAGSTVNDTVGDAVATHTAPIESVTTHAIVEHWCGYCAHAAPVPSRCACHRGMDFAAQPRRGHGEPSALTWRELREVDARMAAEAMVLARKYGYASQATQVGLRN